MINGTNHHPWEGIESHTETGFLIIPLDKQHPNSDAGCP